MVKAAPIVKIIIGFFAAATAVLLTTGLLIYFVGHHDAARENNYAKGQCTVVSNDVTLQCDGDGIASSGALAQPALQGQGSCYYYGRVNLQYNGFENPLMGIFQVLRAASQEEAEQELEQKYAINSLVTCYYPKDNNNVLRIKPMDSNASSVAKGFGILFFVFAGITFIIMLLAVCFLLINKE